MFLGILRNNTDTNCDHIIITDIHSHIHICHLITITNKSIQVGAGIPLMYVCPIIQVRDIFNGRAAHLANSPSIRLPFLQSQHCYMHRRADSKATDIGTRFKMRHSNLFYCAPTAIYVLNRTTWLCGQLTTYAFPMLLLLHEMIYIVDEDRERDTHN